ncbi:MAG: peptidyl-prolyl cis-trans isomerase [Candidatus Cloacimonetes bacterium]|nr:peptidyl-prolyl cis-trans isomerase [Candidatus Cloacimonadota bacterium]
MKKFFYRKKNWGTVIAFLILVIVTACVSPQMKGISKPNESQHQASGVILATWDGGNLTLAQLDDKIASFPAQHRGRFQNPEGRLQVMDNMCIEELFYKAALADGYYNNPAVEQQLKPQKRQAVLSHYRNEEFKRNIIVTDQDRHEFYTENAMKYYKVEPALEIFHIEAKNDEEARTILKAYAREQELVDIMNQWSVNKSSRNASGVLSGIRHNGFITGIGKDKVLDDIIFDAPLNEFSGPHTTADDRIHYFMKTKHEDGYTKSLEDVTLDLERRIEPIKIRRRMYEILDSLKVVFHVNIDTLLLDSLDFTQKTSIAPHMEKLIAKGDIPELSISVNDVYRKISAMHPSEQPMYSKPETRRYLISQLLEDELFWRDAEAKGYGDAEAVKSQLEATRRNLILRTYYKHMIVDSTVVSEEETKKFYDNNKEKYIKRSHRSVRMLEFDDRETGEKIRKKYLKLVKKNDEEGINDLTKIHASRHKGLYHRIFQTDSSGLFASEPELVQAIWQMQVGSVSGIMKANNGKHVLIEMMEETPETIVPLDDVRAQIQKSMKMQKSADRFTYFSERLTNDFNLKKYPERLIVKLPVMELFKMAEQAQKRRNTDEAISYYDQVIKFYPNNKDDYKALFMKAFLVSEEKGDEKKAIDLFDKLVTNYNREELDDDTKELYESAEMMLKNLKGEIDIIKMIEEK